VRVTGAANTGSVTSCSRPVEKKWTRERFSSTPSKMRTSMVAPRNESNQLSKISARRGASGSPFGGGMRATIASRIAATPCPVLADTGSASCAGMPTMSSISRVARSRSAVGRSILLITGMISSPAATASSALATVCASTPCAASTTSSAPSHAASERDTS
jgi:hypothetical protein